MNIKDSDVNLNQFTKKPSVYTVYTDTVKNRNNCKSSLGVVNKLPDSSVNAEWKTKLKLYNPKSYKGKQYSSELTANPIQPMTLGWVMVKSSEIGKTPAETTYAITIQPPSVSGVDGDYLNPGDQFTVMGSQFGASAPNVLVEYQSRGVWKYKKCKLVKSATYRYMDAKQKPGKSCMKIYGSDNVDLQPVGYSQVTVEYPKLSATDTASGFIIIDNGIGLFPFELP